MAIRQLPDPALLRKLLRYEPATGKLFWLERTADMFPEGNRLSPAGRARQWNARHAGKPANGVARPDGYLRNSVGGVVIYAHWAVWCWHYGEWPSDQIDHINGDRSDNRIENLRVVTRSGNLKNAKMPSTNTSGVVGVYFMRECGKWRARLTSQGKKIHLGVFENFADACRARQAANARYGFHGNHGRKA